MRNHDYITHPPARVRHNGKTLSLRPPAGKDLDELRELRRCAADRAAQIATDRAALTVSA